jgi:uncharacterized membrane protein YphA (DoxX/SURF4 family)
MDAILWIIQVLLAALFLFSGAMKSTQSEQWLVSHKQTGVAGLPAALIRFIGISEILGAIGLILPWWLHLAPVFTPLAAMGFCIIMALAAPIHYRLKEPKNVATNVMVFLLCAFVAYGRLTQLGN